MKTPTPRKLPSGNWFVRVTVDGVEHSITKPTEKECLAEAVALKAKVKEARIKSRRTLSAVIDSYIESKSNILSPSTVRGYRRIQKGRFKTAMNRPIADITDKQWQRFVNDEARLCASKTLYNAWSFCATCIEAETGRRPSVSLPQVVSEEEPYLEVEEVLVFVQAIKGTPVEIPALLALSSLRSSEIAALTWNNVDFRHCKIIVHGAAVYDEHDQLVHKKTNKNITSRREVDMIEPLKSALMAEENKAGLVCKRTMQTARKQINKICRENNLPEVGLHGLRRSFASLAAYLGWEIDYAMATGGWDDYATMKKIYTKFNQRRLNEAAKPWLDFFKEKPKPAPKKYRLVKSVTELVMKKNST